ncbi:glycosyltransferase family protein [Natronorubrum thiooxidans]|uniref:Nucleotide-diphospho-sugar transferase n=1 Tax=Natronorubrum thiooxidans TaxID=308853 RepID=A0A1N7GCV0_9EURY|nr:hypothetical protein [Natronorubrum thiooxidans]SIS10403.1 hypothetical protein SAMN05421752_11161 [Natronorubrum thiooxidans]
MSKGVLYVGTGERFFDEAVESAESLRETNDFPASILTTPKLKDKKETSLFDDVITIDAYDDLRDKIYNLNKTPYDKTLYLDGDTLILGDISPVFDLLDRVEIAAAFATGRDIIGTEEIPDALPELNTGVVAYKSASDNVDNFFSLWKELQIDQIKNGNLEELTSFGNLYGQTTFREALYRSDVAFSILPPEYNFGTFGRGFAKYEVKILHATNRKWLEPIINEELGDRAVVGNYIRYPYKGKKKRFRGLPVIDIFEKKLPVKPITDRLGVTKQLRNARDELSELYASHR